MILAYNLVQTGIRHCEQDKGMHSHVKCPGSLKNKSYDFRFHISLHVCINHRQGDENGRNKKKTGLRHSLSVSGSFYFVRPCANYLKTSPLIENSI